jgi:hypothetical protein
MSAMFSELIDTEEYYTPKDWEPWDDEEDPSTILFEITDEPSYGDRNWSINEMQGEGRSYTIEQNVGEIYDAVADMLDKDMTPGWYLMTGFVAHYGYDSYHHEGLSDFEFEAVRPATWKERYYFGMYRVEWWVRLTLWLMGEKLEHWQDANGQV